MWTRRLIRNFGETWSISNVRSIKSYVRTPRRVLTEDDAMKLERGKTKPKEIQYSPRDLVSDQASQHALQRRPKKGGGRRSSTEIQTHPGSSSLMQPNEEIGNDEVEKKRVVCLDKMDKTANINFVQLMTKIRSKSYREKTRRVLLEGKRLIGDGLVAGCKLHTLIYCDKKLLEHLPIVEGEGQRILIDRARMATWSLMEAPPGIMAIVERPDDEDTEFQDHRGDRIPLTVVVDGVREPGNMGALIRTLGAAGCERILLTKGSCDPWEEKVLRSGMGAHFRLPIITNIEWPRLINYVPENCRVYLADSNSFEVIKKTSDFVKEASAMLDLMDRIESRFQSQMSAEELKGLDADDHSDQFGDIDSKEKIRHEDGTVYEIEPSLLSPSERAIAIRRHLLPIFKYFEPSYFGPAAGNSNHCLLIVGGETSSLSAAAYQFAHLHSGVRVHVPMCNGVNSLSVGAAIGVVAFEIQRQWMQREPIKAIDGGDSSKLMLEGGR